MVVFDTETVRGLAILLCWQSDCKQGFFWIKNREEIEKFFDLCLSEKSDRMGFCYNLDYDVQAILKHLCSIRDYERFYIRSYINYGKYRIYYVPSKFLRIKSQDRGRSFVFYDLQQYYATSLDKAAKKFGISGKIRISSKIISNLKPYLRSNKFRKRLLQYCQQDVNITWDLATRFRQMTSVLGLVRPRYISCGSLAKQFLYRQGLKIYPLPNGLSKDYESMNGISQAYHGGRVEFIRRGYVPDVYIYDINSAYPSAIRDLRLYEHCSQDNYVDHSATGWIAKVRVSTYDKAIIQPYVWNGNPIIYPILKNEEIFLCNEDGVKNAKELDVIKCWNFYGNKRPYRQLVEKLYAERKSGDQSKNYIYKIVLNSLYGKFAERRKQFFRLTDLQSLNLLRRLENETMYDRYLRMVEKCDCDCMTQRKRYIDRYCSCNVCIMAKCFSWKPKRSDCYDFAVFDGLYGRKNIFVRYSNVLYACQITAHVRRRLYDVSRAIGEHNIVGFMTDAIFTTKKIPDKFLGSGMGFFSLKDHSDVVVIGSGIYHHGSCPDCVSKFRGYNLSECLLQVMKKNYRRKVARIRSLENVTMGRIVNQQTKYSFKDLNELIQYKKNLDANFDKKRIWSTKDVTFGYLLDHCITSRPICVG